MVFSLFDRTDGKIIVVTFILLIFAVLFFYPARDWLPFAVFFPPFMVDVPVWWTFMRSGPLIAGCFSIALLIIIVRKWA